MHTKKCNTKNILQVIKGWYLATTYITPMKTHTKEKKHKTHKTKNLKIDYCNLLNRMF